MRYIVTTATRGQSNVMLYDYASVFPAHGSLEIGPLARLFKNTSSTYKFYWCLSLLDALNTGKTSIPMDELIARMLGYACFPVNVCRLALGPNDSLPSLVDSLQTHLHSRTPNLASIRQFLVNDKVFANQASILKRMVPYYFLAPWLGTVITYRKTKVASQEFTNDCLYAIGDDSNITINPIWVDYLRAHGSILRDFTLWNLTQYVQKRNPNVPNISGKMMAPAVGRPSLVPQHRWWDKILANHPMRCIYSGTSLGAGDYDLDHFIPWSFVTHNQLWNLIPSNKSVNSSKNDNLPSLDRYLHDMAKTQYRALQFFISEQGDRDKLLEDFYDLQLGISELKRITEPEYENVLRKNFTPMVDIASNMGFVRDWIFQ